MMWHRSNNESYESSDNKDPKVDFEQLINQAKKGEPRFEENGGTRRKASEATLRGNRSCELRRWWREKRGQGQHLHVRKHPRWVGDSIARLPIHLSLVLLGYARFELEHRAIQLPLNPKCSLVKQKLRRMKPEMSLKIKEEVKKQFDAGFLVVAWYPEWVANIVPEWVTNMDDEELPSPVNSDII